MGEGIRYIKNLVKQGENKYLEFKRKAAHPEKIMREVVAFANTDGGKLLVGVDDNGDIPGLKYPEEEEYILQKSIKELCSPKIDYSLQVIRLSDMEDRAVLYYEIAPGDRKPYYAREKAKDKYGKAYIRLADKSIQASREMVGILKYHKKHVESGFQFGEKESMLMQYLESHGKITLKEYSELAKLSIRNASNSLVTLVSSNVLRVQPREKEDVFYYNETSI